MGAEKGRSYKGGEGMKTGAKNPNRLRRRPPVNRRWRSRCRHGGHPVISVADKAGADGHPALLLPCGREPLQTQVPEVLKPGLVFIREDPTGAARVGTRRP